MPDTGGPKPAPPPDGPIKIKTPSSVPRPIPIVVPKAPEKLELAVEDQANAGTAAKKVAPKRKVPREQVAAKRVSMRVLLVSLLVLAATVAGGVYFYQRHKARQERAAQLAEHIAKARQAMGGADANHWQRAASAANDALGIDENNPQALGLAADPRRRGSPATGVVTGPPSWRGADSDASTLSATRRPNTNASTSELLASRLAPCAPVAAVSPQAHKPGSEARPHESVHTPPMK